MVTLFPLPEFLLYLPYFTTYPNLWTFSFSHPQNYHPHPQNNPSKKKNQARKHTKINKKKITCCQNLVLVKCDIWGPWQWVVLKIFGNHKRMVIGQKKGSKMAQGKVESLPRGWIHLQPDKFFSSNFLLLFSIFLSSQKTNSWFD